MIAYTQREQGREAASAAPGSHDPASGAGSHDYGARAGPCRRGRARVEGTSSRIDIERCGFAFQAEARADVYMVRGPRVDRGPCPAHR